MPGDVEQDLRLRVRQVELCGFLPQELPEGGAAEAREEIDEPLRLPEGVDARTTGAANGQDDTSGRYRRGAGPSRSCARWYKDYMVQSINYLTGSP
jgi:hypothetical protein